MANKIPLEVRHDWRPATKKDNHGTLICLHCKLGFTGGWPFQPAEKLRPPITVCDKRDRRKRKRDRRREPSND